MDKSGQMEKVPSFRNYDKSSRRNPYGWDYYLHGKRLRVTFRTKAEKATYHRDFVRKWYGDRDAMLNFDQVEYRRMQSLMNAAGSIDAVESAVYIHKDELSHHQLKLSDAIELRIQDVERRGINPYRDTLHLARALEYFGDLRLEAFKPTEVSRWITGLPYNYITKKGHLKALNACINHAVKLGKLNRNPVQSVTLDRARIDIHERDIIEPQAMHRLLLGVAHLSDDRPFAALLALLFLTGMRVSLIAPGTDKRRRGEYLTDAMINAKRKEIHIPARVMKTQRALDISGAQHIDNLWPFLEGVTLGTPIGQTVFNNKREAYCKLYGVQWSPNLHRRSCASYYAALWGKPMAAELLGNSPDMIASNYQTGTFQEKAEEYFHVDRSGYRCGA